MGLAVKTIRMTKPTKTALNALIEQQKTALDMLIKNQTEIEEMAYNLYYQSSPKWAEIYEKLAHVKRHLYKAGAHCGSCAEKLEKTGV